jgi:NAD+ synthase (glutamine-hydrolysing)
MMKIALAQLNFLVGDFTFNTKKIIDHIHKAKNSSANLVVFSELSVAGYPPKDFLDFDDFLDKCWQSVLEIASECKGIAAIVGCPTRNPAKKGKRLFNSAVVLSEGNVLAMVNKTLLPTYDVFDEYRYFEPNRNFEVVKLPFGKFALTICEDLWNVSDYPLYVQSPMEELMKQQPEAIINIAASPFHYNQNIDRAEVLRRNALRYKLPVLYVNQVGAQTELIFDGGSMVINSNGDIVSRLELFKEDFMVFATEKPGLSPNKPDNNSLDKIELIHDALVLGIRDYFGKLGLKKAILGLSGGIDSAVVLVLAARALGNKNVMSLLLPSGFSSGHSVNDAVELAHNLHTSYELIQIENSFQTLLSDLKPYFKDKPFDVAEENIQARIRAVLLMAFSNKFGYILLNTSNKSEAAVGYGTLYGDMCGGLSVLGDVYKTEVYELARFINRDKAIIPENIITKPPSAELRPDQKDSDSLPVYDLLDKILFAYIEQCQGPEKIIKMGFEPETVKKVLKLVNSTEWKRHQTPPILRVSPKAFGFGRRMPIAARYLV